MGDKICVSVSSEVKGSFDTAGDFGPKYKTSSPPLMTASVEKVVNGSSNYKVGEAAKGQPNISLEVTLDSLTKDDKPPPPKIAIIVKVKASLLFPTTKSNTVTLKGKTEASSKIDEDVKYLLKEWLA